MVLCAGCDSYFNDCIQEDSHCIVTRWYKNGMNKDELRGMLIMTERFIGLFEDGKAQKTVETLNTLKNKFEKLLNDSY